jgi:pyruvate formate lyase activating enzyme
VSLTDKKGLVFNIQRFCLHDGPGIRTVIFLKGCYLSCKWCCNPEGQVFKTEILFNKDKCIKCGDCIKVCKKNANYFSKKNNEIIFEKENCKLCGNCVVACLVEARSLAGKWYSVDDLLKIVLEDEIFYRNSNGGVTLSGGEPSFQYDFTLKFLEALKNKDINTAIETCGYIEWKKFKKLLCYSDCVIFDFKNLNDKKHIKFTGVSNRLIITNLKNLLKEKKKVFIRIALIPGFNDSKQEKDSMIDFIKTIKPNVFIEFINYHELGKFKYGLLGKKYDLKKK